MVGIEQYRRTIGLFSPGAPRRLKLIPSSNVGVRRFSSSVFGSLVIIVSLAAFVSILLLLIESNPGPASSSHGGLKSTVQSKVKLLKLNQDIVEIASHRFFLEACAELEVVPRGLRCHLNLSSRKTSESLRKKFNQLNTAFSLQIVQHIIQDYNQLLHSLTTECNGMLAQLRTIVPSGEFQTF